MNRVKGLIIGLCILIAIVGSGEAILRFSLGHPPKEPEIPKRHISNDWVPKELGKKKPIKGLMGILKFNFTKNYFSKS